MRADIADNVEAASGAVQFKRGWVEKHAPFFEAWDRHMLASGKFRARDAAAIARPPALVGAIQHSFLVSSVISARTPRTGKRALYRCYNTPITPVSPLIHS